MEHRNSTSMRIANLTLTETGTYNPMALRPFETHIDGYAMDTINGRMEQAGTGNVTSSLFSGVAGNIIRPSTETRGVVPIPCGWAERRIRFMLQVHCSTTTGSEYMIYFQGYTSHLGVAANASIDPNMEFYINSYVRVNRFPVHTDTGTIFKETITESAQIVNGQIMSTANGNQQDVYKLRPEDVFQGIQSSHLQNAYENYNGNSLLDTRTTMNNDSIRSSRNNNVPSAYLSRIVDSYTQGSALADFGQNNNDIMGRCYDISAHAPVAENPFIRALSATTGFAGKTSFKYGDLVKIDSNVPHVTDYLTLGTTQLAQLHSAGQTEHWSGTNNETIIATILSNSIPALMAELMLSRIIFRSTNHDMSGVPNTIIIDGKAVTNCSLASSFELFKRRFEKEIMFDVTNMNQDLYMIEADVSMLGETRITISINNGPMIPYVTPSFCDSLLAPIITNSKDNFSKVVSDFDFLFQSLPSGVSLSSPINNSI